MAKFCSNCGGQIPEGANNCPGCGKPVANNPVVSPVATAYQQPAGYPVPAKTNNTAKYIGIGAVVVVAIIVIVILFNLIKGIFGASYTKPIDNMFKGIEKQSWKTFSSALFRITSYNVCYTKLLRQFPSLSQADNIQGVLFSNLITKSTSVAFLSLR